MSKFRGKSFAFVASAIGVALMTGAASAQKAAPVAAPAASAHPATVANVPPAATPAAKSQTKVTPSIVVVVTNSRSLAGLHPATDSVVPYILGHIIPVPSETQKQAMHSDDFNARRPVGVCPLGSPQPEPRDPGP